MTLEDHAIWTADIAERQQYDALLTHIMSEMDGDRATGVFEDDNSGEDE